MSIASNLHLLPSIEELRRRCQALAVLDTILCPEWEYRYFSFNSTWAPEEMLSSMRNGEGDDWLIFWNLYGVIIKGFVLESSMAEDCPWAGVLDAVPQEAFGEFLGEPAFALSKTSFCVWRLSDDPAWTLGPVDFPAGEDPDGAAKLLRFLDGDPATYRAWGEEYFGNRLNPRAVDQIYRHDPLSDFLVRSLNSKVRLRDVQEEIEEIGYPL